MRAFGKVISVFMVLAASAMFFASFVNAATLTVKTKEGVGNYLVDDKGMTLYMFKKDAPNMSVCGAANDCIKKWPLFLAENVTPNAGIDPAAVGTITREDGLKQTTYKGQPLYYFFKDKAVGDTNGQAVNNVWFVVAP